MKHLALPQQLSFNIVNKTKNIEYLTEIVNMKSMLTIIFFSFICLNTQANSDFPLKYCAKDGDSINSILNDVLHIPKKLTKTKNFWRKFKTQNKHIEDLTAIKESTPVYIYVPSPYRSKINMKPFNIIKGKLTTGQYIVKKGDTVDDILMSYFEVSNHYIISKGYRSNLERWNPYVSNIHKIKEGTKLYVEYPKIYLHRCNETKLLIREVASVKKIKTIIKPKKPSYPANHRFGAFYAISLGSLNEVKDSTDITSEQNSPVTLGLTYERDLSEKTYFSSSLYVSYLNNFEQSTGESLEVPMEYGLTAYRGHKMMDYDIYYGVDYEKFTTFNTSDLGVTTNTLETKNQALSYVTFGVSKYFPIKSKGIFTKFSFSKNITSTNSDGSAFTGYKWIGFAAFPINKKISVTGFVKQHLLEGDTDLTITRYGFGVGFNF